MPALAPPTQDAKLARAALAIAGLVLFAYALRVLLQFGFAYTNEDQTVMWLGVRDYARLRFYEPYHYGASYDPMIEAVAAAPLKALGVPLWIALPLCAQLMGLTPWFVLAALCWRTDAKRMALALLAAPLLASPAYTMLLSLSTYGGGIFLVALGLLVMCDRPKVWAYALGGALFMGGVVVNPNCALFVLPAGLWLLSTLPRDAKTWAKLVPAGAVGLAFSFALKHLGDGFYAARPHWAIQRQWPIKFEAHLLWQSLRSLSDHWGDLAPPFAPGALHLVIGAAIVAVLAWGKRWWSATCVFIGYAFAVGSLGLTKMQDGEHSIFFSFDRMYLALPVLAGFGLFLIAREVKLPDARALRFGPLHVAAAIVAVGALQHATMSGAIAEILARPVTQVGQWRVEDVRQACERLHTLAQQNGDAWVLEKKERTRAYGCSALYDDLNVIFPFAERRAFLLKEAAEAKVEKTLSVGLPNPCARIQSHVSCHPVDVDLDAVQVDVDQPVALPELSWALGMPMRRF